MEALMSRLDRQKPPIKLHRRGGARLAPRGYRVGPHPTWGDYPRGAPSSPFIVDYEIFDADTRTAVFKTNECTTHPATWDFGDGSPIAHILSYDKIFHAYNADGDYNVITTCHGQTATITVTIGVPLTITSLSPTSVRTNVTFTMTINGTGFQPGCQVRFWDGNGQFSGQLYIPDSITPTVVVVTAAPVNWAVGTGGVDVYGAVSASNQMQFQITT